MSNEKIVFCNSLFNRYYECIRINVTVFGKERGPVMCDNIKQILNVADCVNIEPELNTKMDYFINKIAEEVEKNK